MDDGVVKVKNNTTKLVLGLHQNHGVDVSLFLGHDLASECQLVNFYKEPGSKHIDHDMHVLAKGPCDISPRDEVDKCVDINGSSRVGNGSDVTLQLGIVSTIGVVQVMV